MVEINTAMHVWLNVATVLVASGAVFYISLCRYMTKD
jgi:hypothetical protein